MFDASEYTLDVADVVALEQMIAADGTSLLELMNNAGAALAQVVGRRDPQRVVVLAGSGNNGGDGWAAAELLCACGCDVAVVTPRSPEDLAAEPARTAALHARAVAPGLRVACGPSADELAGLLGGADVAVDALLGTGFSHDALREPLAGWVEVLNAARGLHVVAADVPSGLSAQTGLAAEPHVVADETVTMMVRKPGLSSPAGLRACGTLQVAAICDLAPYAAYLRTHAH